MPFSIQGKSFDESLRASNAFLETDLTWLCPRLLRQPVCGAAFDGHCFESCNLSSETKDLEIFKEF